MKAMPIIISFLLLSPFVVYEESGGIFPVSSGVSVSALRAECWSPAGNSSVRLPLSESISLLILSVRSEEGEYFCSSVCPADLPGISVSTPGGRFSAYYPDSMPHPNSVLIRRLSGVLAECLEADEGSAEDTS